MGGAFQSFAEGLPGGASSLNETHGNWRVSCASGDDGVKCVASQTQVQGENRQRVLAIEFTSATGNKGAAGLVILPFGLKLDSGVVPTIDDDDPMPALRFSTCMPQGCLVPLNFDARTLAALKQGNALALRATANGSDRDVAFSIPLSGFASAFERLRELNGG
ncbi:invasion associated locus B family protein [Hoeflea sp.]|uniref:invasion associated locus B family protein n=1 Tax=Hoeflea sp. TaxID=1940281 RepID=UPI003B019E3C